MKKKKHTKEHIKTATIDQIRRMKGRSDWKRVDAMTEKELEAAIAADPDSDLDVDWSKAFWGKVEDLPVFHEKEKISVRLDKDVLDWFRKYGRGYQTRLNAVLRSYVESHQDRR